MMFYNFYNVQTDWIEKAISKKQIKYYDYKYFKNVQEISIDGFEKVYRANWKNSERYFVLKPFLNVDEITVKELVRKMTTVGLYFVFLNMKSFELNLIYNLLVRISTGYYVP